VSVFSKATSAYSGLVQARLAELRQLVLDTAARTEGVGTIEEALRWGQPSFLTCETKSGSNIRIDGMRNDPEKLALYVHCQSGLIDLFKAHYSSTLIFDGKRAIVLDAQQALPKEALAHCISLALTHHLRKKSIKVSAKKK
jgi:Domain of unknown function (DU1801)